ncbi:uncharacterized protein LOC129738136 [Uranotaenia lowii]|uniref:uncharacterized protein LOC129738136 n=1 Tax=Uranotaenia lowii TaxID=190385 RepID=UPI002479EF39|nr:uncharacterized protein LOC129738136 [Uranotaenia lowii]
MKDYSILKKRQLWASIKGVANFVRDYKPELHESQVEVTLSLLESTIKKYYLDAKESEAAKKWKLQKQAAEREAKFDEETLEVEEQYCTLKATLFALRPRKVEVLSVSGPAERADTIFRVKLPVFNGKLRDWIPFRDMLDSFIHNNRQLSDIDKFTYLRSAINGEALQEISSIELSADNYQVACDMLEKSNLISRFGSIALLIDGVFGNGSAARFQV